MDNGLHILFIWIHLLGVATFLGGQVFLAFAWIPTSRAITDQRTRVNAMRSITRRFGYLGGGALILILLSGGYLIATWRDFYTVPDDAEFTAYRYGVVFITKMTLLIVMLALLALHTFVLGPRLVDRLEAQMSRTERVDEGEIRSLRKQSMWASIGTLLLTLAIVALGATLSTSSYSLQDF